MPRYILVSSIGGIIHADTKDEPGPDPVDHMDALRRTDENLGEVGNTYTEVAKDDPEADMHVYRAVGIIRDVERDATYVTSVKITMPSPTP